MNDDNQLIELIRGGSAEAFEILVRRHQAAVRWLVGRMVGDPQTADDLAQDVFGDFVQSVRCRERVEFRSVQSWLLAMARNKARDSLRRRCRQPKSMGALTHIAQPINDAPGVLAYETPEDFDSSAERLLALQHCVSLLQPKHREIIDEHYGQAKSSELIAARLGKASGAVRMMLWRVRRALAKCIRKQLSVSNR